jgi:hypothetical protein
MSARKLFWVGMEDDSSPGGHGEDYRTYVFVDEGANEQQLLRDAVLRISSMLKDWHPSIGGGFRIAVRLIEPAGQA